MKRGNIHTACRLGSIRLISTALSEDPTSLNLKDSKLGWTALFRCVVSRNLQAVEFLLRNGANPDLGNDSSESPLHQAAETGQFSILKLLLNYGASVNLQDELGESPLHRAVAQEEPLLVQLLLEHGSDPNLLTNKHESSLDYAVKVSNKDIVKMLSDFGGKSSIMDETFYFSGLTQRTKQFGKLYYWLENLGLEQYYQTLVKNGYDNLDELVHQMKTPIPLTSAELQNAGINRTAHRYKILIQLSQEAEFTKRKTIQKTQIPQCCACTTNPPEKLEQWLQEEQLSDLLPYLQEAGYDPPLLMLQSKTSYRFNHFIMKNELQICERDRRDALQAAIKKLGKFPSVCLIM